MSRYIWYVMLNSGKPQKLTPESVDDTIVAMARGWLDEDGHHRDILPGLGIDFVSTCVGSTAFCTIQRSGTAIAEFAITKRSIGAAAAWSDLHSVTELRLATQPDRPPQAPWVGLVLLPAMRREPETIALTAVALAKACAWAWIEKRPKS